MGEEKLDTRLERQLAVIPEREPLTEDEARAIGTAANRLPNLRTLLEETEGKRGGAIGVGSGMKMRTIRLPKADIKAALSLLIERDEMLLASFNVTIARPE